jgi:hypothetical protein
MEGIHCDPDERKEEQIHCGSDKREEEPEIGEIQVAPAVLTRSSSPNESTY